MFKFVFPFLLLLFVSKTALALNPILPKGIKPTDLKCITIFSQKYCVYISSTLIFEMIVIASIVSLIIGIFIYRTRKNTKNTLIK